jgi:hypothetical protein
MWLPRRNKFRRWHGVKSCCSMRWTWNIAKDACPRKWWRWWHSWLSIDHQRKVIKWSTIQIPCSMRKEQIVEIFLLTISIFPLLCSCLRFTFLPFRTNGWWRITRSEFLCNFLSIKYLSFSSASPCVLPHLLCYTFPEKVDLVNGRGGLAAPRGGWPMLPRPQPVRPVVVGGWCWNCGCSSLSHCSCCASSSPSKYLCGEGMILFLGT